MVEGDVEGCHAVWIEEGEDLRVGVEVSVVRHLDMLRAFVLGLRAVISMLRSWRKMITGKDWRRSKSNLGSLWDISTI